MLQISYQSDMENILLLPFHLSEGYCYLRLQSGCLSDVRLPTWQLPRFVLPESHHHHTLHIPDNPYHPSYQPVPFLLRRTIPVLRNLQTYQHPEYVSYPDVPVNKNLYDAVSQDLLPENILCVPVQNIMPELHVLSTAQICRGLPSSDSSDPHSSLQNTDMS